VEIEMPVLLAPEAVIVPVLMTVLPPIKAA